MVTCRDVYQWIKMPGARVLPCHSSQLKLMKLHPMAQQNIDQLPDYHERIDQLGENGFGWTVLYEGRFAAMFGISMQWNGMAEAWLMVDTMCIHKHRIRLTKGAKNFFDNIGPAFDLRRCQIMVSVAHKEAVSWARLLHFELEATLKQYGPDGQDHLVYARFYRD